MKPTGVPLDVLGNEAANSVPLPPTPSGAAGGGGDPRLVVNVDVVSDVICPWCYVGKRRLTDALALLAEAVGVRVTWRPFQLNPVMPREGIDRREYRTRKFGSWEHSQALDARLVAVGRAEGLDFRFDRIA